MKPKKPKACDMPKSAGHACIGMRKGLAMGKPSATSNMKGSVRKGGKPYGV